ncbi:hypothetical protein DTL00_17430 [Sphingomonas melonis]
MRKALFTAISLGLLATAVPSIAAPCRDAKGKFVKCPEKAPVKAARCKSANGKFAKCGTPGAKPM